MAIGRGPGRAGAIIDPVLQRAPESDDQLRQRNFGDALGDGRSTGRDNQVATFEMLAEHALDRTGDMHP